MCKNIFVSNLETNVAYFFFISIEYHHTLRNAYFIRLYVYVYVYTYIHIKRMLLQITTEIYLKNHS